MEGDETSAQLVESAAPRVQRSFADFRGSHADLKTEREKPELLAESPDRRRRIAKDSGKTEQHVSQLVAQLFQMRVRMKNLMGIMESGSIPTLSNLEDAMKAEQTAPPGTARRKRRSESRRQFADTASTRPSPRAPPSVASSSSSSSASFPLVFGEHQQLDVFRQPSKQSQASGSDFPVPSWSHPSHYPSSTGS
ncbi:hypothetical protein PVK06_005923 [Gossypium arboreum]|uniref:Signal recognition particle SRP54 subunit M-domain domain-containing protein n=1 Tax=Gossypium arboreum TaxID=29729 RepID=A0ABR0QVW2_GOSAR|nr:hypothetical protein PVK06_005923 [Gossypium arboreum]